MFQYRPRSAFSVKLRLLEAAADSDVHASVLDELGRAIKKCDQRIAASPSDDVAVDMNCELVEALLGTAHVVCQVKITAITEAAIELIGKADHEIRAMGPSFNTAFSKVEVLWALGNYFKHRDEWELSEWAAPTGFRKFTIPALKAAGLHASSTGNLRTGAEALGDRVYSQTAVFRQIVDDWAAEVARAVRSATPAFSQAAGTSP
jgi:hypothetical protein